MRTRPATLLALLVATCLLLLPAAPVRAGEADGEVETAPPPLPKGKEAFLTPTDRTDLVGFLQDLRRRLEQYETPPPSTEDVTALKDAWNAILRPRVGRMLRRIDTWLQPDRWDWVPGEATPVSLQAGQWPAFVRDMASLATELHGAWQQYGSVKLRPKDLRGGTGTLYQPPAPRVYLAYGWPTLYGSILDRQAAARDLGVWDAYSYWHLLDRFRYAWDWSWERRRLWYEHWQRRQQATEDLFEDLRAELDATREALGESMLGLQAFVAALQNLEEERLFGQCTACRVEDAALREMAETALRALANVRLEGERYQGRSSAAYGSILRRWLRAQKAAAKVMEIASTPETEDASPADETPADETPADGPAEPPAGGAGDGATR